MVLLVDRLVDQLLEGYTLCGTLHHALLALPADVVGAHTAEWHIQTVSSKHQNTLTVIACQAILLYKLPSTRAIILVDVPEMPIAFA